MQIEKKTSKEYFEKILSGEKKFDLRLADWDCKVGDVLLLKEWDEKAKKYTGREITKNVSYILKTKDLDLFPSADVEKYGYQILSLRDGKSKTGIDHIGIAVAFLCHDGKGNVLFHKRSQNCRDERGVWDDGGGKLEFGEDFKEGALRELKEEYCCSGEIEYQFPALNCLRENDGVKTHWIIIHYIIKVNPAEVKIGEPKSMDELGWFKLDNLPEPLHPVVIQQIKNNKEIIKRYIG